MFTSPETQTVCQRSDISAESKLTWLWLWHKLGGRSDTISITTTMLASTFGKSTRSAQRWIHQLTKCGLVEIASTTKNGWVLYVLSPSSNGQLATDVASHVSLATDMASSMTPHVASHVSRSTEPKTPQQPQQMTLLQRFTEATGGPTRARTATDVSPSDIRYRNRDLNQISDIGKFKSEKLFERAIADALGDMNLRASPLGKVARALSDEAITWEDVARACALARQKVCEGKCPAAWIYFVGAMKRKFEEIGRPWKRPG